MASSAAQHVNGHFACVKCYIFVHFSSTPTSILNLTTTTTTTTVDVNAKIANVLRRYDVVTANGQWAAGNELLLTSRSAPQYLGFVGKPMKANET